MGSSFLRSCCKVMGPMTGPGPPAARFWSLPLGDEGRKGELRGLSSEELRAGPGEGLEEGAGAGWAWGRGCRWRISLPPRVTCEE